MKRTLFVTSNRLGDAVLTTGVLHYLLEIEPDVPITVVCGHLSADIFKAIPGVERVVAIKKRKYSLHWPEVLFKLGFTFWHRVVDYRGSPLGFLPAHHHHNWRGSSDDIHKVIANARVIGVNHPLPPKIVPGETLPAPLAHLKGSDKLLAIAPTANAAKKQWHFENYLTLAKALTEDGGILAGAHIAVLGAPGEEAQSLPVVRGLPSDQVINLVGKTTPLQVAEILSHCDLFVGNDSGLMHTAVAVNIPTVGLFGVGKPAVYGPWGERSLCLKGTPHGEAITRHVMNDENGNESVRETLPAQYVIDAVVAFYQKVAKLPTNKDS